MLSITLIGTVFNVYSKKGIMKVYKKIGIAFIVGMFVTSCVAVKSNGNHGLPPGQVKKVTGAKSARNYAPGHNK